MSRPAKQERVVFFGDGPLADVALRVLERMKVRCSAIVVHPRGRNCTAGRLQAIARLSHSHVIRVDRAGTVSRKRLNAIRPTLGLCAGFGYRLAPDVLACFPKGVWNLHTSYLPYNRGAFPNVWAILDKTPAGATLHRMDAGLDTGPILARIRVKIRAWDTGETLYLQQMEAAAILLQRNWNRLLRGRFRLHRQPACGTFHRRKDVERTDEIPLQRLVRAGDLIDLLRARTFPPFSGAWFRADGRRIFLRLFLEPAIPTQKVSR